MVTVVAFRAGVAVAVLAAVDTAGIVATAAAAAAVAVVCCWW